MLLFFKEKATFEIRQANRTLSPYRNNGRREPFALSKMAQTRL
jgi:hypothetical protein